MGGGSGGCSDRGAGEHPPRKRYIDTCMVRQILQPHPRQLWEETPDYNFIVQTVYEKKIFLCRGVFCNDHLFSSLLEA